MVDNLLKEKSVWEKLMETRLPLILYGMGDGADKVVRELELLNLRISGVTASDEFIRGQTFRGFEVKTLSQIEREFSDFVLLITFGSNLPRVRENIKELEKSHRVLIPSVPVAGECIFNRSYLIKNGAEIKEAYKLMADEESRRVFECMCYFQYTGELRYLFDMESSRDEAYKILNLTSEENYLDIGAYRGDTIDEFLKYTCGRYRSITALEPDKKNFEKLASAKGDLENAAFINKGIWNYDTQVRFDLKRGKGNVVNTARGVPVPVKCIDSLARDTKFSYIKMDVEGVEFVAISGGYQFLSKYKPKLNVACYHRCCDIYRLPVLIHRTNPGYKIYMRHHPCVPCWDTNLYCI